MLRTRISCVALSFFAFFAASGGHACAEISLSDPAVRTAIDAVVAKGRTKWGGRAPVPAVLVGVWNASGSYTHAYGFADLKTHRALTTADHFRIGSNTKTFVISVILQLVDEGKLSLDDPVSKFALGVNVPNGNNITIRELCQMRSGLLEAYDSPEINKLFDSGKIVPDAKFDARTVIRWAVAEKPYFPPGTSYHYSNTNYLLLGLIVQAVTHDTIAHEIQKRLIERFGLAETSYPDTQAMPDPWAHGYGLTPKKEWEDVSGTIPVSLMGAAGEMISDMNDMKRWVTLYVTGKTNGPKTQRERLHCLPVEGNLFFGLGIGCSAGYFGYTGGLPGYNTANYYLPANGTMILVWVPIQDDRPPGVANAFLQNIARIVTPRNVPFILPPKPSTVKARVSRANVALRTQARRTVER
jgi:D-alanyl-D-alanine carboxypeptidase